MYLNLIKYLKLKLITQKIVKKYLNTMIVGRDTHYLKNFLCMIRNVKIINLYYCFCIKLNKKK